MACPSPSRSPRSGPIKDWICPAIVHRPSRLLARSGQPCAGANRSKLRDLWLFVECAGGAPLYRGGKGSRGVEVVGKGALEVEELKQVIRQRRKASPRSITYGGRQRVGEILCLLPEAGCAFAQAVGSSDDLPRSGMHLLNGEANRITHV